MEPNAQDPYHDSYHISLYEPIKRFGHRMAHDQAFNNKMAWLALALSTAFILWYTPKQIDRQIASEVKGAVERGSLKSSLFQTERESWRSTLEKELFIPAGADTQQTIEDALNRMFPE